MGFVDWLKSAGVWISTLLNRKVCTADELKVNVVSAMDACDPDADGNISVREFITFVLRLV